jgi:C-terminal processing protease CtpA/Prc
LPSVAHLPANIGRLEVTRFFSPDLADPAIDQAMQSLADTDALLIDVRAVGGGNTLTVYHLASYFFGDPPVHMMNIYDRRPGMAFGVGTQANPSPPGFQLIGDGAWAVWSHPVPGPRYLDKPVYVLTSAQTASASEALAFILQTQHRALLVGETTVGAAHFTYAQRVGDQAHKMASLTR